MVYQVMRIEGRRTGYSVGQVYNDTFTVGQMKQLLEEFDDNAILVLDNDSGYTFGEIADNSVDKCYFDTETEEFIEDWEYDDAIADGRFEGRYEGDKL